MNMDRLKMINHPPHSYWLWVLEMSGAGERDIREKFIGKAKRIYRDAHDRDHDWWRELNLWLFGMNHTLELDRLLERAASDPESAELVEQHLSLFAEWLNGGD